MAQETNTIKTVIEIDARGSQKALGDLEQTIKDTVKSVDSLHASEAKVQIILNSTTESFSRQSRTLNNLEKRYAPLDAEMRKFSKDQEYLNKVVEKGGSNADRASKLLEQMAESSRSTGRDLSQLQQVAGQAGYQIADLANQIAIGHNAFLALGMQAGQFVGVLGPMGAVIGAVITVMGVLIATVMDSKESMDEAGSSSEKYKSSLDALKKISEEYKNVMSDTPKSIQDTRDALEALQKQVNATKNEYESFKGSFGGPIGFLDSFEVQIRKYVDVINESGGRTPLDFLLSKTVDGYSEKLKKLQDDYNSSQKDLTTATDQAEATREKTISKYIDEERKKRQENIELLKLEGDQRERQKAIIEAEARTRSELTKLGASSAVTEDQVKQAKEYAAAVFDAEHKTAKLVVANDNLKDILKEVSEWEKEQEKRRKDIDSVNQSTQAIIDKLKEETYQLELNHKERFIRNELLKAENDYKSKGLPIDQERINLIKQEAENFYDLRKAKEDSRKADDEAERERKRLSEAKLRDQERMIDNIVRYGADRITDSLMSSTQKGWSNMLDTMFTDFQAFLVRAAAEAALKPLAAAMFGGSGSSDIGKSIATSAIGKAMGMSNEDGSVSGFGSLFSGSLQYAPYGMLGAAGANMAGLGGTNKFANLAGGLGGGIAGAMGGAALAGTSLATALGIGGAVLGPVGAILGGVLGTAIGGLFSSGPKSFGSNAYIGTQKGQAFLSGSDTFRGGDASKSLNVATQYIQALNNVSSRMGGTLNSNPVTRFKTDEKYGEYQVIGVGTFKTGEEALQAALGTTLRNPALWSGLTEDIRLAMKNSKGDIAKLGDDIDFAMSFRDALKSIAGDVSDAMKKAKDQASQMTTQYREMSTKVQELGLDMDLTNKSFESGLRIILGLKEAQPVLSDVEQAIAFVNAQFKELQPLMEKFGITTVEAAVGLQNKLGELRSSFDEEILNRIMAIADPVGLELKNLESIQKQRLKDAQALGANILEVEKLNSMERMKVLEKETSNIRAWLDKQILGETSSLNGADKLATAQGMFSSAIEGARRGSYSDLTNLTTLADAVIESARAMYASSENYSFLETMVRSQLESVGRTLGLNGFASGTNSAPSGLALVGEKGAELINFRGGESVYTAGQTQSILAANSNDSKAMAKMIAELVVETRELRKQNAELVDNQAKLNNKISLIVSQSSNSKVAS